jgi:hypothetical protein
MASQYYYRKSDKLSKKTADKNGAIKFIQTEKFHSGVNVENKIDLNFMGSREERAATRTIASRQRLHDQMNSEIESFLAHGGEINKVDAHVTADPPKRPVGHYGQRPI